MIDGRNFLGQPVKNDNSIKFETLQIFMEVIVQLVVCQIIFTSKKYYTVIAIYLSKQQELDIDLKINSSN